MRNRVALELSGCATGESEGNRARFLLATSVLNVRRDGPNCHRCLQTDCLPHCRKTRPTIQQNTLLDSMQARFLAVAICHYISVVLVWLHIIRFSFSKKGNEEQSLILVLVKSTKKKKGLLKHLHIICLRGSRSSYHHPAGMAKEAIDLTCSEGRIAS